MTINDYFDKVICINRDARKDRWGHVEEQCQRHGVALERFRAHDLLMYDGRINGNFGCTASHRGVLELISHRGWNRVLVLEDDFLVVVPDLQQAFASVIDEVPLDWDMLYLGGHYAEAPQYLHSTGVVRINRMLTTSSYGITATMARKMAPYIYGVGPIDSLYGGWHATHKCFILKPRLMTQYETFSDLQDTVSNNTPCMLDTSHEDMLLTGCWYNNKKPTAVGDTGRLYAKLNCDVGGASQLVGKPVIVDGQLYTITDVDFLGRCASIYRRGEQCAYRLTPKHPNQELDGTRWKP